MRADTSFLRLGHVSSTASQPVPTYRPRSLCVCPAHTLRGLQHIKLSAYKYKIFKNSELTVTGFVHVSWQICAV